MKSVEFVLWANGAAELIGDEPPTKEQWLKLREKLGEAVGTVVASKLLEKAEEAVRHEALAREKQSYDQMLRELQAQKMAAYRPYYGGVTGTAIAATAASDNLLDAAIEQQRTTGVLSRALAALGGGKIS